MSQTSSFLHFKFAALYTRAIVSETSNKSVITHMF